MKKGLSAFFIAFGLMAFNQLQAHAQEIPEVEENDSTDQAQIINSGITIAGDINNTDDEDNYTFELDKTSKVKLTFNNLDQKGGFEWNIFDENNNFEENELKRVFNTIYETILPPGSYYVAIINSDNIGSYQLNAQINPLALTSDELHTSDETALLLQSGVTVDDATTVYADSSNEYQLELTHKQRVHFDFINTEKTPGFEWSIYDADSYNVMDQDNLKVNSATSYSATLDKGVYYLNVENLNHSALYSVRATTFDDIKKPVIKGAKNQTVKRNTVFDKYKGIEAIDEHDGDITKNLTVIGKVNIHKKGMYSLTYKVTDEAGNVALKTVEIIVK